MADSKIDELFRKIEVSSAYDIDYDEVFDDSEDTKASGTRARVFIREIGIEKDIQQCLSGIRAAKGRTQINDWRGKLDALLKIVQIHKAAADTANKNSALASADGSNFDEVKVTLNR